MTPFIDSICTGGVHLDRYYGGHYSQPLLLIWNSPPLTSPPPSPISAGHMIW